MQSTLSFDEYMNTHTLGIVMISFGLGIVTILLSLVGVCNLMDWMEEHEISGGWVAGLRILAWFGVAVVLLLI